MNGKKKYNSLKKILLSLIIILATITPIMADSESLNTEITTVSFGPHGFGFGLAPAATNFMYHRNFNISDQLDYPAFFYTRLVFSFNHVYFYNFLYDTGTPVWIKKDQEIDWDKYINGWYFSPTAYTFIFLSQEFGINPIEGSGSLFTLGSGFFSRFSMALEDLDVHKGLASPLFVKRNPDGTYVDHPIFGKGKFLQAYPWLSDNRQTFTNYFHLTASLNLTKDKGFKISDGLYSNLTFEYGPWWLANKLSMNNISSDFYYIKYSLSQYLALYSATQKNGWNWLSIELSHTNTFSHTGGDIVPYDMLPSDRLENNFSDSLAITFFGPQFIAYDCYTDLTLRLSNYWYFGNIVNEKPKTTKASEWQSSLSMYYHMRLFGFMHFSYEISYDMMRGIHTSYPTFRQKAEVSFYIAL